MFKLIKLEWKKNNIAKYIRSAIITTGILMLFLFASAKELEGAGTLESYEKGMLDVSVALFVHMTYIIFTGVMLASFIVGAYEKKTINLMFSYPISRQKILLSKIFAVWIFNFIAMTVSKVLIYVSLKAAGPLFSIKGEGIFLGSPEFWLKMILSSAVMVSVSFLALAVGMKMRSSKAVIVTSVLVVCLTQGQIGAATLADNLYFFIFLLVLAAVAVYLSIYHVETKDLA